MISLFGFFLCVVMAWLWFSNRKIKQRLHILERKLAERDNPREQTDTAGAEPPEVLDSTQPADPALLATPVVARSEPPVPASSDPTSPEPPNKNEFFVFSPDRAQALWGWLQANWFYAVSAISLALAGVFFVQYGIENGLLPPVARVAASLGFGAVLIGAGEWVRRRFGDDESVDTAYLPSVFAAAGIVTLFAAIVFARLFYDLIGVEVAFAGLILVAAIAVLIGWFYGPLLAAVGIGGGIAAPFMTGGQSEDPSWLFGYFALIVIVGLAIDTMRRWAWVSVLALVLGGAACWLIYLGGGEPVYFVATATVMVIATALIPMLSLRPAHQGAMASALVRAKDRVWPEFPTRLVASVVVFWAACAMGVMDTNAMAFWAVIVLGVLLSLFFALWLDRGPALTDVAMLVPLVMLGAVVVEAVMHGAAIRAYFAYSKEFPEDFALRAVTLLLVCGVLVSLAFIWRSLREGSHMVVWCLAGCLVAPLMAIALHLFWDASWVIGDGNWALHIGLVALVMGAAAQRFAALDGDHKLRVAMAAMAALAMISLAAFSLFAETALTIALAATIAFAAFLDRRFNLGQLGVFIAVGVGVISYRLLVDPGFTWGFRAPIFEVLLTYCGGAAGLGGALYLLRGIERQRTKRALESGLVIAIALLASVLVERLLPTLSNSDHAMAGMIASIWLIASFAHFYRHEPRQKPRHWLALVSGVILLVFAVGVILLGLTLANPLHAYADPVLGLPLINSLLLAYLLPAVIFEAGHRYLGQLPALLHKAFRPAAILLAVIWAGFTIRHFWRGPELSAPGTTQPELYSYTIALLLVGAVLIYRSIAKRSDILRKAGLAVIALAVVKVFLIDIAGLSGLTRVFSFLALGLCLAGLAWLNRWASAQSREDDLLPPDPKDQAET